LLLVTCYSGGVLADETNTPLSPADTSSPRSTLTGFIEAVNGSHARLERTLSSYLESPRLYFSSEERAEIDRVYGQIDLARRTLNLSELAKALAGTGSLLRARIFQLKEVLDRLELPAPDTIPDGTDMASREFKRWTIPGTEIVIDRVERGLLLSAGSCGVFDSPPTTRPESDVKTPNAPQKNVITTTGAPVDSGLTVIQ
jgi:MscS family membrane protein